MVADLSLPPLSMPDASKGNPEERYMALHSQQASIHRRLSTSSPPTSLKSLATATPEMSASESSSVASSPTLSGHSFLQISPPTVALPKPAAKKSSRTPSMSPMPEDTSVDETNDFHFAMSADESKLYDVNHDIKSILTELLNCEAVRHDHKMRIWVQTRLLDAERELKKQRKRRVSTPTVTLSPSDADLDRRRSN